MQQTLKFSDEGCNHILYWPDQTRDAITMKIRTILIGAFVLFSVIMIAIEFSIPLSNNVTSLSVVSQQSEVGLQLGFANIGLALLSALLAGLVVSVVITRPIRRLVTDVDSITSGELDITLKPSGITEVSMLTDSLNRVLASMKLAILRTGMTKQEIGLGEAMVAKEEAEHRYEQLIATAPMAIITLDTELNVLSWNPAAHRIFEWQEDDILGRSLLLMLPREERREMEKSEISLHGRSLQDVKDIVDSLFLKCAKIPISTAASSIRTKKGEQFTFMISDMTESRKSEAKLINRTLQLERFSRLAVGREEKMIELKQRIAELERMQGKRSGKTRNLSSAKTSVKRSQNISKKSSARSAARQASSRGSKQRKKTKHRKN